MTEQNLQKNESDDESNNNDSDDKDEELSITNSISNLSIATAAGPSVVPQTSHRDTLHAFLTKTASDCRLVQQYKAPIPKIVLRTKEATSTDPVVLCVFLGPSYDTCANNKDADPDWNPFTRRKGGWTKSIGNLDKELPLEKYFLVDAFPLLFWGKGDQKPDKDAYLAHYELGVKYVRRIITVIRPCFVLAFGRQSGWVTYVATGLYNLRTPPKRPPIKSWMDPTSGNPEYAHPKEDYLLDDGKRVYFCYHPSYGTRGGPDINVFEIPCRALAAIRASTQGAGGEASVPVTGPQEAGPSDPPTTIKNPPPPKGTPKGKEKREELKSEEKSKRDPSSP
jgi:hypothetical protein